MIDKSYSITCVKGFTTCNMIDIQFDDKIKAAAPSLKVLQVEATVANPETSDELWNELETAAGSFRDLHSIDMVNKRPAIMATREAYKRLGKDPNRYRPSAEALCRRIVNGKGLYRLTTIVDLINLLSVWSGHSIGGFDAGKIVGDCLTLGRGEEGEEFDAIGRGMLNIDGLPVYRDAIGGIGTPTSDCERTKLTPDTTRLLMLVNMYGDEMPVDDMRVFIQRLLSGYASASDIEFRLLECNADTQA